MSAPVARAPCRLAPERSTPAGGPGQVHPEQVGTAEIHLHQAGSPPGRQVRSAPRRSSRESLAPFRQSMTRRLMPGRTASDSSRSMEQLLALARFAGRIPRRPSSASSMVMLKCPRRCRTSRSPESIRNKRETHSGPGRAATPPAGPPPTPAQGEAATREPGPGTPGRRTGPGRWRAGPAASPPRPASRPGRHSAPAATSPGIRGRPAAGRRGSSTTRPRGTGRGCPGRSRRAPAIPSRSGETRSGWPEPSSIPASSSRRTASREPGPDLGPPRLGQRIDQLREMTRLDLGDRHQLPAAGSAARPAGDPLASRFSRSLRHVGLDRLGERVEDRQDRAGGHRGRGNRQRRTGPGLPAMFMSTSAVTDSGSQTAASRTCGTSPRRVDPAHSLRTGSCIDGPEEALLDQASHRSRGMPARSLVQVCPVRAAAWARTADSGSWPRQSVST